MTQRYVVDGVNFDFADGWLITKYDEWQFYRQFLRMKDGIKAVDLLVLAPDRTAYFVKSKITGEESAPSPANWLEIIAKVFDTLAAIVPAKINGREESEREAARRIASASRLRVILHLEQPLKHSKLFPRAIDTAGVEQKLKQGLKPIDAHPKVAESSRMRDLPWSVA